MADPACYIGLMSGTSVDAADAVAVCFDPEGRQPRILATHAQKPNADLRDDLLHLSQQVAGLSLAKLGELDQRIGAWFAAAAQTVMDKAGLSPDDIHAIGCHGQTVRHEPDARHPFSIQLGSAALIAAQTGCRVVADFRSTDIALGGQGAPLVPAFHRSVFADTDRHRVVINIGGIANVTVLPRSAYAQLDTVAGLDTGPGNALMDAWIAAHLGKSLDEDGGWAARGSVDETLLTRMMADPYLSRCPPKSTGREYFNLDWLRHQIDSLNKPPSPVDVQATLCEYSARTIAQAVDDHGPGEEQVLLCGGGVRNTELVRRLRRALAPRDIRSTDDYGVDADWVEAIAFAWLAMRTVGGQSGNLPSVTGARASAALGAIYQPALDTADRRPAG